MLLDKKAAAERLGVSVRLLELYATRKRIGRTHIKLEGQKAKQVRFDSEELDRLKAELEREKEVKQPASQEIVTAGEEHALAIQSQQGNALERLIEQNQQILARAMQTPASIDSAEMRETIESGFRGIAEAITKQRDKLLTIRRAAQMFGLSITHIKTLTQSKTINLYKLPGVRGHRVKYSEIAAYIEQLKPTE